jgi:hypothetical protein
MIIEVAIVEEFQNPRSRQSLLPDLEAELGG